MNKFTHNIPNLIKQPGQCCIYCGKSYKAKTNLDKHIILCELLERSKKNKGLDNDEDEYIPSPEKMFSMLKELATKFNKLEEKYNDLKKDVVKKNKKINAIEWLNTNVHPEFKFDYLIEHIKITEEDDVKYLYKNSVIDTINYIFSKNIYNSTEHKYPIMAFIQKPNMFYIYDASSSWIEISKELFIKFINRVHVKLYRVFGEHKKSNAYKLENDENLVLLFDKISNKMCKIDFSQENIYNKVKSGMYSKMKIEIPEISEN